MVSNDNYDKYRYNRDKIASNDNCVEDRILSKDECTEIKQCRSTIMSQNNSFDEQYYHSGCVEKMVVGKVVVDKVIVDKMVVSIKWLR